MAEQDRSLDIVIFGATGFTGTLVVEYFASQVGLQVKWAVAGRSQQKLNACVASAEKINPSLKGKIRVIIADGSDSRSIDSMVQQTRVILSTAGPFSVYSDPVVQSCVKFGTDYVDTTGESPWVRTLIDRYHDIAVSRGISIIPMCGFDSIPADLGALQVVDYFSKQGKKTRSVRGLVSMNGGASGGTVASLCSVVETTKPSDLADPYLLNPDRNRKRQGDEGDQIFVRYEKEVGKWSSPFIMGIANTRVVRRSNAILQQKNRGYGDKFQYNEAMKSSSFFNALFAAIFIGILSILLVFPPARRFLTYLLPAGQGPSAEARKKSFFQYELVGAADDGTKAIGYVSGGDPGYTETSKFVSEAALFLLLDKKKAPLQGGILTPASGLGLEYIERLKKAGINFKVVPGR